MNLQKLLAENMLRFGTKNLDTKAVRTMKRLAEQTSVAKEIYNKLAGSVNMATLPRFASTYQPTSGYIQITDGNPWLATNRAKSLQTFLINQFQTTFKIPFDAKAAVINNTQVLGPGDENQYTLGTLKAKLRKKEQRLSKYPYELTYNFYDINGTPYIVVTKLGEGSPMKVMSTDVGVKALKPKADAIPNAILVKSPPNAGRGALTTSGEAMIGIMIPITSGYAAKDRGRLYFTDVNEYQAMKNFITKYTRITNTSGIPTEVKTNDGITRTGFTMELGGSGNYIFGDLGAGRPASILSGAGEGTVVNIKRMEASKIGNLPGTVAPGSEEQWVEIGSFKLDRTVFPDNLITIPVSANQTIINLIQNEISELTNSEWEPISMTAEIQGFASKDSATNRCPRGFRPDHAWGGSITADKWITL